MDLQIPPSIYPLIQEYPFLLKKYLVDRFTSAYLVGSIALGNYQPIQSDIDFLIFTSTQLTAHDIDILEKVHKKLLAMEPNAAKLDGVYLPISAIGKTNEQLPSYPYVEMGELKEGHWDVNHVTWWIWKYHGILVAGEDQERDRIEVPFSKLKETMNYNLTVYWPRVVEQILVAEDETIVADAVLTICRIAVTLKRGIIVSKTEAGSQCLALFSQAWQEVIQEALDIRAGKNLDLQRKEVFKQHAFRWIQYHIALYKEKDRGGRALFYPDVAVKLI